MDRTTDSEQEQWEKDRDARYEARYRKQDRAKIAGLIYRDAVAHARHGTARDERIDLKALACEAVEAAEALLDALDGKPPVDLPEYRG